MILGAAGFLVLLSPIATQAQDEHTGTFEEVIAHHSLEDLKNWRANHPWSLGDRLADFMQGALAIRRAGERLAIERANVQVSFLAETIAEDPMSGWLVGFLQWDTEACARQETASEAMKLLPQMIAGGEGDAAWAQIEEFRGTVREGGWQLLGPDLARCAATYLHAGDRARAKAITTELEGIAEGLQQGVVLAASQRILGEIDRLEGRIGEAARRTARAFEVGAHLDSGPAGALLESIEGLAACDVDTLVEVSAGKEEALLVLVGENARSAKTVPLADVAKRVRELSLGKKVGVVAEGAPADLPFEAIAGVERSVVRLARPPLGAPDAPRPAPAAKRIWIAILDEKAASPAFGGDEVRVVRAPSAEEIRKAAPAGTHLYVDADLSVESLRGCKLAADVAVLARPAAPALVDALHACGVRDVLARSRAGGDAKGFLEDVCARLARGETLLDAIRSSRTAASEAWVVRRRS
jgi:hypothetical protein